MKKYSLFILFQTIAAFSFAQNGMVDVFSQSYAFENNNQYAKAITTLEAVYVNSSYPLNLRMGWLHYLKGEHVVAQSFYKKAIALQTKSIEARLGYVYPTSAMENWNDVVSMYKEVLEIDVNNSLVNYRLASIYFYRKNYETAKIFAQKVTVLYPFDFDTNYLMAQIELGMGNIMEAKAALVICLQYNPLSIEAKTMWEKLK